MRAGHRGSFCACQRIKSQFLTGKANRCEYAGCGFATRTPQPSFRAEPRPVSHHFRRVSDLHWDGLSCSNTTCSHISGKADSVAVDPHKWLYAPLEAGCALVRDPETLRAAFTYHPPYYHFEERVTNYVDYGPQNSRGFRALKVWLALKPGAVGYRNMIAEDIRLSQAMAKAVSRYAELQLMTQELSM